MNAPTPSVDQLTVDLGDRSYPIRIGTDLIGTAGSHIAPLAAGRKIIVVTDDNVAPIWLDKLLGSFEGHDLSVEKIVLPASEATKSFSQLQMLLDQILGFGIDRKTTLVALGGGVIGDITGFAASILLRGIAFIQIPTTLLAQVDSSVGGKTGINTPFGKNLVGAFHQPKLVLCDIGALDTLPKRQLLAGYAEVVKYGLIDDFEFFEWCERHALDMIKGDPEARRYCVLKSCQSKARIVANDELETGQRALLNLGHTFAHAYEAETGFGDALLHGEAVAIGCIHAFALSAQMGLCDSQELKRVEKHFSKVGLHHSLSGIAKPDWTVEKIVAHMSKDKKAEAGKIKFILAHGIGKSFVCSDAKTADLEVVLANALSEAQP